MADLYVSGIGSARSGSSEKVTSNQNTTSHHPFAASSVITKRQMEVMRKMTSYKPQQSLQHHKEETTKDVVADNKNHGMNDEPTYIPKLNLGYIKRNEKPDYYVTEGVDTSRTVLSWGAESTRPTTREASEVPPLKCEGPNATVEEAEQQEEILDLDGDIDVQKLGAEHFEAEDEAVKRKRQEAYVEEQMVMDLTQPETTPDGTPDSYSLRTPWATSEREDFYALNDMPKIKRLNQKLHSTSSELSYSDLKKRGLEDRLRFKLRFITRSDHDSLKDLHGFYFPSDNTMTIYEYRELGKKYSAAPIFSRASYPHLHGKWLGNTYNLRDIKIGNTLYFATKNQHALPDALRCGPVVPVRITSVNENHVLDLICKGLRIDERNERVEAYRQPERTAAEVRNLKLVKQVQDRIRCQISSRPLRYFVGLRTYFKLHDENGDGAWRMDEMEAAIRTYRLNLTHGDFLVLWSYLDEDRSGLIDFGEFLRGLVGEMSEARYAIVRRAWCKMDCNRRGEINCTTIRHFYNPVISLDVNTEETGNKSVLMEEFLECFNKSSSSKTDKLSFSEFVDYYTAISISEGSDEVFAKYMKTCWNI